MKIIYYFYKEGIYKDIDNLVSQINSGANFINLLKDELEKLIGDDKSLFSKKDCSLINSKYNERDGHYMLITNRRCKILKTKLRIHHNDYNIFNSTIIK